MKVHPPLILLHGLSRRNLAAGPDVTQNRLRCPFLPQPLNRGARGCFHPHAPAGAGTSDRSLISLCGVVAATRSPSPEGARTVAEVRGRASVATLLICERRAGLLPVLVRDCILGVISIGCGPGIPTGLSLSITP